MSEGKPTAATESDQAFLARLERIGRDYRYSDEFVGLIVRHRFPREWPWSGDDNLRPAVSPAAQEDA